MTDESSARYRTQIASNLQRVQQRLAEAAASAGRNPAEITLVAVTKTFPSDAVLAAYELGLRHFGENRVEEAIDKIAHVQAQLSKEPRNPRSSDPTWHLIGHLQSRKAKDAAPLFDYIHSVDSVKLAEHIEKNSAAINKSISVLLEVNTSGEESKFGFPLEPREDFIAAAQKILALPHLNVVGLMTIAPIVQAPEDARPYFRALRFLRDELQTRRPDHAFPHLSMGMTDDFEAAILEGATMVRIGRAIFGERN